jgi:hypothetical protein
MLSRKNSVCSVGVPDKCGWFTKKPETGPVWYSQCTSCESFDICSGIFDGL